MTEKMTGKMTEKTTEKTTEKMTEKMTEKQVEQNLVAAVHRRGGLAPKFTSPGWAGVPDRLVLMPDAHMAFVELKAPGQKMRPLQLRRKRQLEELGFRVYCVDDPKQIGGVLDEISAS